MVTQTFISVTQKMASGIESIMVDAAELKALRLELEVAWERRIEKLLLETNSTVVIEWLNEDFDLHPYAEDLLEC
ncbi:hypothetical protein LguiA_025518 [Lonicera macranthoides]